MGLQIHGLLYNSYNMPNALLHASPEFLAPALCTPSASLVLAIRLGLILLTCIWIADLVDWNKGQRAAMVCTVQYRSAAQDQGCIYARGAQIDDPTDPQDYQKPQKGQLIFLKRPSGAIHPAPAYIS